MPIIRTVHPQFSDLNAITISGVIASIQVFNQENQKMVGVGFELINNYTVQSQRKNNKGNVSTDSTRYPKLSTTETKIPCIAIGFKADEIFANYKKYDKVIVQGRLCNQSITNIECGEYTSQNLKLIINTIDKIQG
jgi:hypothetical protein